MKSQLSTLVYLFEDPMLPCFSKQLFGVDCPGCGLQRSAAFLMKGEFLEAFQMYPAIYPMILLFAFLGMDYFLKIKHANKIIIVLMISTVFFILTNFFLKFF